MQKLKALREERVLSQRELARMANLAQGTVWRIEKGFSRSTPRPSASWRGSWVWSLKS